MRALQAVLCGVKKVAKAEQEEIEKQRREVRERRSREREERLKKAAIVGYLDKPGTKLTQGNQRSRSPEKDAKRTDPKEKGSGDKWKKNDPEKADRKERKGEPLPGAVPEDPAEKERRLQREGRFGKAQAAHETKPRRSRSRGRAGKGGGKADLKPRPAAESKPKEEKWRPAEATDFSKTNAEERKDKPAVSLGLRGWSDDDAKKATKD